MTPPLALLLLPLCCSAAAAERPAPEYTLSVQGELVIAPDGSVQAWKVHGRDLAPSVSGLLQRSVEQWRFEPILQDGAPVAARTRMALNLELVPRGADYVMRVTDVYFGSLEPDKSNRAPSYPAGAVRKQIGARVLLALKLGADGRVLAMHPWQTSLTQDMSDMAAQKWRRRFEQATMAAAAEWKYVPGESVGGVTVESSVIVPVEYRIDRDAGRNGNAWRGFLPGPVSPAPWTDEDSVAALDADGLPDGQAAMLDSRFRLKTEVRGKSL